ncbi:Cys-Gln thioester bond-forming surface protein [Yinghuangia sp. YIM S09857]|uniref:Cys-Gln thioester bond-forming surface protein n=1 Tax=Yinghuangia sp. YIM S09857 TaxID=3436929 RepID=UPI003F5338B5
MFRTQRGISRAGSAVAVAGATVAALLLTPGSAIADIGMTAKYDGSVDGTKGSVWLKVPDENNPGKFTWRHPVTNLKKLKADGGLIKVYCIDLATSIKASSEYREGSWSDSWLNDSEKTRKINWVLNNSYPKIDNLNALATTAGIDAGKLDIPEAVAATQAAIWHFSNGAQLPGQDKQGDKQVAEIVKLYKFLTGSKNTGVQEPKPALTLDPDSAQGVPGDTPIGPLKIETNATGKVDVKVDGKTPEGVSLVGKDGKPVADAKNGTELYAKVPAGTEAGKLSVTAQTETAISIGRVFIGKNRKDTQTLISAGATSVKATAKGSFTWAPQPKPVPGADSKIDCAQGGLEVTLTNSGDAPADFQVGGTKVTVPAESSKKHLVKVGEDQDYTVKVTGPEGFEKTFEGKLDCETPPPVVEEPVPSPNAPEEPLEEEPTPSTTPTPSAPAPSPSPSGPELAETGGSDSSTGLIAGIAGALLLAGGGAVFLSRRRGARQS